MHRGSGFPSENIQSPSRSQVRGNGESGRTTHIVNADGVLLVCRTERYWWDDSPGLFICGRSDMDCAGPEAVRRLLQPVDMGVAIDAIVFEKERRSHGGWGDEGPSRKPPSYK